MGKYILSVNQEEPNATYANGSDSIINANNN